MDLNYLEKALDLAEKRRGFCAPNPAVGAVVVKEGKIIGQGNHWACGYPHAEVAALQPLTLQQARGATLYVTLEPCSHYGRTPPCTELIINKGIVEVVYAQGDPNPQVAGQGAEILRQAGIICRQLIDPRVQQFYQSYRHWLETAWPYVTLKIAVSLDGKISGPNGKPLTITNEECQKFTHQQRLHSDALLTTIGTIIADNPQLNARINNEVITKPIYVLDSQLRLSPSARIFQTAQSIVVFHCDSASAAAAARLTQAGAKCRVVGVNEHGLNLKEVLTVIGQDGCHELWVEAGGRSFYSFIQQRLAQQLFIYVSPRILGPAATPGFNHALDLLADSSITQWRPCGTDAIAHIIFNSTVD